MKKIKIEGNHLLEGTINISGAKNSAVALIPASILSDEEVQIDNIPNISDIEALNEILTYLGATVVHKQGTMIINPTKIVNKEIPESISTKLRASYYFMAALLGKYKKVEMYFPGGCKIGSRPIDQTLKAFELLGAKIKEENNKYTIVANRLIGTNIYLDMPSVGATINTILASVKAEGKTIIENAAKEPEIVSVATFLNNMGAKITGAGTSKIKIEGVKKLKDISYNIMPDRIETGTFLCAAAMSQGNIIIENTNINHITPIISKLEEANCKLKLEKDKIELKAPKKLKALEIRTMPYPGFPTDMQSIFVSMLTIAKGTSIIVENIFESRYKFTQELIRMGAKITIEGKSAIVKGTRKLYGANVNATDLRGGAALVLAGIVAKGETTIENIEYILRGYENLNKKLENLGVNIKMV